MKKFFSLLAVFTFIGIFTIITTAKAQTTCDAKVVVHYHRFNNSETNYEFYSWDNGMDANVYEITEDEFGGVATIPVCSNSKDQIGLIPKLKGTWDKDGIDANDDGQIDDKTIDVVDIRGTDTTKHVYVLQGAKDAYYQNVLKDDYFGKSNHGNLVVVYYDPTGNEEWDDFWTFWTDVNRSVPFDYNLGISGGTDPDLFRVAVLSVPATADEQVGFIVRKNTTWDVKDDTWKNQLTEDTTDELGHTYKMNGDRLINVSDIRGNGTKFVFVINGVKTIFEDFDVFVATAFKLEFTQAQFRNTKALSIVFNQNISYPETGPDKANFTVKDDAGNVMEIDKITYNSLVSSANTFNIVLKNDIVGNKNYTVTYNYEQFGEQKTVTAQTTVADNVFPDDVVTQPNNQNYWGIVIAGVVVLIGAGAGIFFALSRRKS